MRISDWSSDVCSSDLAAPLQPQLRDLRRGALRGTRTIRRRRQPVRRRAVGDRRLRLPGKLAEIRAAIAGRAVGPAGGGRSPSPGVVTGSGQPALHDGGAARSEEHTSELQSLMRISYAVFCLKKKNTTHITEHIINTNQNKK